MENELAVIKEESGKTDDPHAFWQTIVDIGKKNDPHLYWEHFVNFDIDSETQTIVDYLKSHLAEEPIPEDIKHIYFGLFETGDDQVPAGFYICGSNTDPDEQGDFLCHPAWFPEWRQIHSKLLNDVMFATFGVLLDEQIEEENLEVFDYFLIFSAAITIVKGIMRKIPIDRNVYVGFDNGDFMKVNGT